MLQRRKVYAQLAKSHMERCNFGHKHIVTVWRTKYITVTDETYLYDNGYEKRLEPVWVDYQGRKYFQQTSIDFAGNSSYCRKDGTLFFTTPFGEVPKDTFGNLLT